MKMQEVLNIYNANPNTVFLGKGWDAPHAFTIVSTDATRRQGGGWGSSGVRKVKAIEVQGVRVNGETYVVRGAITGSAISGVLAESVEAYAQSEAAIAQQCELARIAYDAERARTEAVVTWFNEEFDFGNPLHAYGSYANLDLVHLEAIKSKLDALQG